MRKLFLPILVVCTALAGACGSDDEAVDAVDTTTASTESTAPPATGDGGTTTLPADLELTDSFRGVTADTIKVGYSAIDFERLNSEFGIAVTYASYEPVAQAFAADLNERGGILGRQVEVVVEQFLPVGAVTAEEACLKLTQDEQVFVVLNGFAGPGVEPVNECVTDLNDTILVGGQPTQEQIDRIDTPWVSPDMDPVRRGGAFVRILSDEGELDALGNVALIMTDPDQTAIGAAIEQAFADEGGEISFSATLTSTGDEVATRAETRVLIEKARAEGANSIMQIGSGEFSFDELVATGDEFTLVMFDGDRASGWRTDPPPGIENVGRLISSQNQPDLEDPLTQHCIEIATAAYPGVEIKVPQELEVGETNYWAGMANACRQFALLEQIAIAAGPDLTNDSFAAAADAIGEVELEGWPYASLGQGKFDARDTLGLAEWNTDTARWEMTTDPIDVS